MGSYNYTISIGHLGEQLTLNQWVLGSSPRWCTIPSRSERAFKKHVRIFLRFCVLKTTRLASGSKEDFCR